MNQLIESLGDFSHARNFYAGMAKFLSVSSEYREAAKIATPFVILGFMCVWIYVTRKWRLKKRPEKPEGPEKPVHTRSRSLKELYGGEAALRRFDEYKVAQANPATLNKAKNVLKALLKEEHLDLKKLQSTVAKLEMSGREAIAVNILRKALPRFDKKPHEAYEIEMLLVEMLIFKADYQEAMQCKCLEEEIIVADARRPLYKAVLHLMLKEEDKARIHWEKFIDIHRQFVRIKAPYTTEITDNWNTFPDFQEFKKKVKDLKSAIEEVKAKQPPRK